MTRPDTHYARSGAVHIAYQVVGSGPLDLVFVPGFISNLELHWEDPGYTHLLWRLAGFSRLILFDKRGTGLSDPVARLPTLEQRMDDVRAVMDAAGSPRAALLGASEGGPMAMLFAATYPERTQALVLYGAYAHFFSAVLGPDELEAFVARAETGWGNGDSLKSFAPGQLANPRFRAWWARFERLGASPAAAIALARMNSRIDVRPVLPAIRVPALVVHRRGDVRVKVTAGRELAARIRGAKYVEIPGTDHPIWVGDTDRVVDEIEEFLTGMRPSVEPDRLLKTVLAVSVVADAERDGPDPVPREDAERLRVRLAVEAKHWRGQVAARRPSGALACFDGPARAIGCALATRDALRDLGIEIRAGVHAGEVEIRGGEMAGAPLRTAARICSLAAPGAVLVSGTVRDLLAGSDLHLSPRGDLTLDDGGDGLRLFAAEQESPPGSPRRAAAENPFAALSCREREILGLVALGLSNQAIAARLTLSEHTVKRHVANLLMKLDLPTRTAAAALAVRHGVVAG